MYFKGKTTCQHRNFSQELKESKLGPQYFPYWRTVPMKARLDGSMDDIVAVKRPEFFEICKPLQQEELLQQQTSEYKALKVNSDFWADCHSSQQKHLKMFCIGTTKRNNPGATIVNQFKIEILKAPFQVLWLRTTCLTGKAKPWKSVISGHYT